MFASVSEASLTFTCVCAAVDPAAKVNSQSTSTPQRRVETLAGFAVTKKYKCIASTCTDTWCDANCNHDPKYCPASFCREVVAPATLSLTCTSATDVEAASILVFTTSPSASAGGVPFASQPVVKVQDTNGNTVTSSTLTVTLTVESGTGVLNGITSVAAVSGVASFTGVSVTEAGEYILTASARLATLEGTVVSVQSSSFTVSVGAAAAVSFKTSPSNTVAGAIFATQPVAVIVDAGGNTVTSSTAAVTVSVASGSGTLSGTMTVAAVAGVATFGGLTIDAAGRYTLSASIAGALKSGTSSAFAIFAADAPVITALNCTNATLQQPLQLLKQDGSTEYELKVPLVGWCLGCAVGNA